MTITIPSVDEVVPGQIYLGNLQCALSAETLKKFGITHILSVCPDFPSTDSNHLTINVEDIEYENILIHLPGACKFIDTALGRGGRVLVHCVMGISRSTTVVAAYLMKTRKLSRSVAIKFIKKRRPEVHPNYGFIKQLEVFAECQYLPSPTNEVYCRWRRQKTRNVTQFLNQMVDTTTILPNQLHLSSDFPEDVCQSESLILDSGITHVLSISPAQIPSAALMYLEKHQHIEIPVLKKHALFLALPDACRFIEDAISSGGEVLVHSQVETTACIVVCAFLMFAKGLSPEEASAKIQHALPLFNTTKVFSRHLQLFDACQCNPSLENPLVQEWIASGTSPTPTPHSGLHNITSISGIAADVMSETGFDLGAFGKALAAIECRI